MARREGLLQATTISMFLKSEVMISIKPNLGLQIGRQKWSRHNMEVPVTKLYELFRAVEDKMQEILKMYYRSIKLMPKKINLGIVNSYLVLQQ